MSQITKEMLFANLLAPIDANNVAKTTDELSFENYKHITFVVMLGNINGADCTITVEKCTDAAGGSNTAIGFNYRVSGAAAGATEDTLGTLTAVASTGLVCAHASYDNKMVIIEIDDTEVGATYSWVRCVVTPGAVATLVSILGICSEPRYTSAVMPSAIS